VARSAWFHRRDHHDTTARASSALPTLARMA
jgi:hypothetical protein